MLRLCQRLPYSGLSANVRAAATPPLTAETPIGAFAERLDTPQKKHIIEWMMCFFCGLGVTLSGYRAKEVARFSRMTVTLI